MTPSSGSRRHTASEEMDGRTGGSAWWTGHEQRTYRTSAGRRPRYAVTVNSPLVNLFDIVAHRHPTAARRLGWRRDQARARTHQLACLDRHDLLGRPFDHELHAELDDLTFLLTVFRILAGDDPFAPHGFRLGQYPSTLCGHFGGCELYRGPVRAGDHQCIAYLGNLDFVHFPLPALLASRVGKTLPAPGCPVQRPNMTGASRLSKFPKDRRILAVR